MDKRQVFDMARKAGLVDWTDDGDWQGTSCALIRLVKLAAEHEREQCAQVCEKFAPTTTPTWVSYASQIRARGEA